VGIEGSSWDPRTILRRHVALWRGVLRDRNRMCPCGMLAAEVETLPKPVRQGLKAFFDANESRLARVLAAGRKATRLGFPETPSPRPAAS
jgi:TetR/AcrR family transcriptional repressor of nem operon